MYSSFTVAWSFFRHMQKQVKHYFNPNYATAQFKFDTQMPVHVCACTLPPVKLKIWHALHGCMQFFGVCTTGSEHM